MEAIYNKFVSTEQIETMLKEATEDSMAYHTSKESKLLSRISLLCSMVIELRQILWLMEERRT